MDENALLGKKIANLRESKKLSQAQVSDYLGITQSALSKMESGERTIGVSYIDKLAALYCMSANDLLYGEVCPQQFELAFRAQCLSSEDLLTLSTVNKVILNQQYMDKL